jgi:hypothetical protein
MPKKQALLGLARTLKRLTASLLRLAEHAAKQHDVGLSVHVSQVETEVLEILDVGIHVAQVSEERHERRHPKGVHACHDSNLDRRAVHETVTPSLCIDLGAQCPGIDECLSGLGAMVDFASAVGWHPWAGRGHRLAVADVAQYTEEVRKLCVIIARTRLPLDPSDVHVQAIVRLNTNVIEGLPELLEVLDISHQSNYIGPVDLLPGKLETLEIAGPQVVVVALGLQRDPDSIRLGVMGNEVDEADSIVDRLTPRIAIQLLEKALVDACCLDADLIETPEDAL